MCRAGLCMLNASRSCSRKGLVEAFLEFCGAAIGGVINRIIDVKADKNRSILK